jgi:uncharacterized protein (DUF1501 family)
MNRRAFLKRSLAFAAAAGLYPLGPHGWAASSLKAGSQKRLIVIFLRGAIDGLSVVIPYGDSQYYDWRPTIAIPRYGDGATLELGDGHFGINPALAPILPQWRDRTLAFVHACGSPDSSRSHFDAQDYMESGTPGLKSTSDGWMNRLLGVLPGTHSAAEAINLGPTTARILSGPVPVANMGLGKNAAKPIALDRPTVGEAFARMYSGNDPLSRAYREGIEARKKLLADLDQDMTEAAAGAPPASQTSDYTGQLGRLIARDPGIRLAFIGLSGWDTHVSQGASKGQLFNHLKPLSDGLGGLVAALGPAYSDTVVMVISEFGRTIHENGNGGTDHGHGNVMWIMGGAINGGKVYSQWPGLAEADLYQGRDLAITTDFRDPICAVLKTHLRLSDPQIAKVFPNFSPNLANVSTLPRS